MVALGSTKLCNAMLNRIRDMNFKIGSSAMATVFLGGFLFWLGLQFGSNRTDYALTYLTGILGGLIGWILGIISSPYNSNEKKQFSEYAKLIYGFFVGYFFAKIDKIFELAMTNNLFMQGLFSTRVMYFLSCLLLAFIVTFVSRRYAEPLKTK
jgi:fructose-specific phosphotransferase system IIC component